MKHLKGVLLMGALSAFSFHTNADITALNAAASKLCDKSKVCLKEEMAADEEMQLPPSMQAMITNMLDEICGQYVAIAEYGELHEIIEPATDCLNAMAEKSCDDLLNGDEPTPACERYERMAEKYE